MTAPWTSISAASSHSSPGSPAPRSGLRLRHSRAEAVSGVPDSAGAVLAIAGVSRRRTPGGVHRRHLPGGLPAAGGPAVDGPGRLGAGQRGHRVLALHSGVRAAPARPVHHSRRSPPNSGRVDRRLQPRPSPPTARWPAPADTWPAKAPMGVTRCWISSRTSPTRRGTAFLLSPGRMMLPALSQAL
jgi:hypothetical protein